MSSSKIITNEVVALPGIKGDKGDPFTYDDFTPEQIEELQRPATEAAEVANAAAQRAEAAAESVQSAVEDAEQASQSAQQAATEAQEAVKNANAVIGKAETAINNANTAAETANTAVESVNALEERVEQAEATRVQSEEQRQTAETNRASSEKRREANETQRQEKFAQIESDATSLENSLNEAEAQRVSAENARKEAETQRETAEQNRETEFTEIKNEAETLITQTTEAKDAANSAATSATNAAGAANTAAESANEAAETANQAAQNVDGRVTALEEKASQTYKNLAAIESSGETNPNKIYIDGETLIPYVYKSGEFVPFSGVSSIRYNQNVYIEPNFNETPHLPQSNDVYYFSNIVVDEETKIVYASLQYYLCRIENNKIVKAYRYSDIENSNQNSIRLINNKLYFIGTNQRKIFRINTDTMQPELSVLYRDLISVYQINNELCCIGDRLFLLGEDHCLYEVNKDDLSLSEPIFENVQCLTQRNKGQLWIVLDSKVILWDGSTNLVENELPSDIGVVRAIVNQNCRIYKYDYYIYYLLNGSKIYKIAKGSLFGPVSFLSNDCLDVQRILNEQNNDINSLIPIDTYFIYNGNAGGGSINPLVGSFSGVFCFKNRGNYYYGDNLICFSFARGCLYFVECKSLN